MRKIVGLSVVSVATLLLAVGVYLVVAGRPSPVVLAYPSSLSPTYEELGHLDDGADHQRVTLHAGSEVVVFGLRSYSNEQSVTAHEWLRARWDPTHLIVTQPIVTEAGNGVAIVDASAWARGHEGESDFPVIAVLSAGRRIVVVDRLNGSYVESDSALRVLSQAGGH
jgi:hypothetical protein